MPDLTCSRSATVRDELGLHVRPAEMLARVAKQYESRVELVYEEQTVDAKSIMHLLTLGALHGATIVVQATGADAEQAVAAVTQLFDRNFDANEAPAPSTGPVAGGASEDGPLGQRP